jgi:hypothetical protein
VLDKYFEEFVRFCELDPEKLARGREVSEYIQRQIEGTIIGSSAGLDTLIPEKPRLSAQVGRLISKEDLSREMTELTSRVMRKIYDGMPKSPTSSHSQQSAPVSHTEPHTSGYKPLPHDFDARAAWGEEGDDGYDSYDPYEEDVFEEDEPEQIPYLVKLPERYDNVRDLVDKGRYVGALVELASVYYKYGDIDMPEDVRLAAKGLLRESKHTGTNQYIQDLMKANKAFLKKVRKQKHTPVAKKLIELLKG